MPLNYFSDKMKNMSLMMLEHWELGVSVELVGLLSFHLP